MTRPPAVRTVRSSVSGVKCERWRGSSRPDQARPKSAAPSPPARARHAKAGAGAAADIKIASGTDPRWATPAEATEQGACPQAREEPDAVVTKAGVPEPPRERAAHGADPRR